MENKQKGKCGAIDQSSESCQISINPDIWCELKKVHRLDDSINIPITLFKYMKTDSLKKSFRDNDKQSLLFVEPCLWKDPFESLIYNTKFKGGKANVTPKTYACCMTTGVSSEAAWLVYGQNQSGKIERCAKLVIDTAKFLKELDEDAQDKGYSVYVGMVDYELSKNIKQMSTKSSLFKKCLDNNRFTLKTFLRLLCLKRKMYHYEEEVRFLLVKDNEKQTPSGEDEINFDNSSFHVCVNLSNMVTKIYLDEMCTDSDIGNLKKYINYQNIERTQIFDRRTKQLRLDITGLI